MKILEIRQDLLQIYSQALLAVSGELVVRAYFANIKSGRLAVIATGKAASSMMAGAEQVLGENLVEGLLITKFGHVAASGHGSRIAIHEAAHPVPDDSSLDAGQAMLDFIAGQAPDQALLLLISGGTSSLVEVLEDNVELADLIRANQHFLASGLTIDQINRQRRQFSKIKAGGLLPYLEGRRALALLISDVPDDDAAVIGSGMLVAGENVDVAIITTLDDAMRAASLAAEKLHYVVDVNWQRLHGDAVSVAGDFAHMLLDADPGVYICGGETTVKLPQQPGMGGRNQHLALAAAIEIAGHDNIIILAAGTDGTDGSTKDAGALVDGQTIYRGELAGFDAADALQRADAGSFLAASGDLVQTGPTGTNVMDLLIGIKCPDA